MSITDSARAAHACIPEGWVVDPFAITRFDRDRAELEALFLFCVAVGGKKATVNLLSLKGEASAQRVRIPPGFRFLSQS